MVLAEFVVVAVAVHHRFVEKDDNVVK